LDLGTDCLSQQTSMQAPVSGNNCRRLILLTVSAAQVLFLGTIALLVGSLATVAVPKLAGALIDICIDYGKGGRSVERAEAVLNQKLFQIIGIIAVGAVATGIRSW
jgi:hypothetical protein